MFLQSRIDQKARRKGNPVVTGKSRLRNVSLPGLPFISFISTLKQKKKNYTQGDVQFYLSLYEFIHNNLDYLFCVVYNIPRFNNLKTRSRVMLSSFLLSLREGIEAALIIGIVLGALRKLNRTQMAPAVWYGTFSAVAVSLITGVLLTAFGLSLEGAAEQIFEGVAMLLAASV